MKSVKVEEKTWEKIMKYKIALRHKSLDETINYFIKRARENDNTR